MSLSKCEIDGGNNGTTPCAICFSPPKFPRARADACDHIFCHPCLRNWLKRRSECPLCKRSAKVLIKMYKNGRTQQIAVQQRTASDYEMELAAGEESNSEESNYYSEESIVEPRAVGASCIVCHQSSRPNTMRYCVGIVGRDADGREIRCNERFHSRCHLEGRSPNGSWFCPFCVDMLHVVEGDNEAYFHRSGRTRYVSRRSTSYVSGPSTRHDEMTERRRSPSCEPGPSRRLYEPNEQSLRRRRQTCVEEGGWETESETEASFNSSGSDESDDEDNESMRSATPSGSNSASEGGNDWSMIDDVVLCEEPQPGYSGNGFTTVSRSRKRRKRQGKKRSRKGKKRSRRTKKKKLPNVRQRLASIVGLNIRTGRVKRRRAMRSIPALPYNEVEVTEVSVNTSVSPCNEAPIKEISVQESSDEPRSETRNVDLLDTIMMEQAKVLAPSNCRALTRDGTVRETKLMAEYIKKVDESTSNQMDVQHVAENNVRRNNTRKNRSTRWDNPSTSAKLMQNANRPDDLNNTYNNINYNTANTTTTAMNNNISKITAASIPLPSGPPLPPISLDNIPIPNRSSALSASISSINTTPSTSFALNLAPPFGLAPPLGLSSVANAHLGQLQLPSQMFPNILMQPSFPVGAMNNILAAGILGNASLGSSISQANNPFVLGQMPNQNAQLTQQIANLTSFQSNVSSAQQQRLPLAGVPPPPPLANRLPETDAASLEPLAERIRQLTEGNVIHPFGENTVCGSGMVVKQCKEDVKGTNEWGGRKSASAEEEEQTIDKDAKVHKNGPMFDQARQLLSESLKKAYKKKRITKDEYKEIMKKGVAALSQRTKLDEKKVAEYANKYVEYMLAKRAKK